MIQKEKDGEVHDKLMFRYDTVFCFVYGVLIKLDLLNVENKH